MPLYELINPSDPYTFRAPSLEIAGAAAAMLSTGFGAVQYDPPAEDDSTPVLFGWNDWMESRGMDKSWFLAHLAEIADALDSFLIGGRNTRADVEDAMSRMDEKNREEFRASRQNRYRTSLNQIGEAAYNLSKRLRAKLEQQKKESVNG